MRTIKLNLKIDKDQLRDKLDIQDPASVEEISAQVLSQLPALVEPVQITSQEVVQGINELPSEEEYQIDASHIKNLPSSGRAGVRLLSRLNDVYVKGITNGQIIKWNSTTQRFEAANESGGGGGTVDTIVGGTGIDVDSTDPANPIVSVDNTIATKSYATAMAIALS